MKFSITARFDSNEEIQNLQLLESLKGLAEIEQQLPQNKRRPEDDLKVFTRLMHNPVSRKHIKFAYEVALKIQKQCHILAQMRPDPKWIVKTEDLKAKGLVPLFANPEQFCKDMRDLRASQYRQLCHPLEMLREALRVMDETESILPGAEPYDEMTREEIEAHHAGESCGS